MGVCWRGDKPKKRYRTQGEARAEVPIVSRLFLHGRVREYKCPRCGYWHLGHGSKVASQPV